MTTYETLLCSVEDRIIIVTIHRPEKLNALNALVKEELGALFTSLASDRSVDVVILTGAGEKSFVAGTDIAELSSLTREAGVEFAGKGQELFDRIEHFGKPVIAAVNGYALGGGCELALACHIRIASDKARFGQPEVLLGIIPGYGGTQRLARLIGRGRAMEMILSGVHMDAQEALRVGLVNRVVPAAELLGAAKQLARVIASNGQPAVRFALQAVNATQEMVLSEGLQHEAYLFGECCATGDFKEGVRAFLEKRKPEFKGV
jgi:enoyl-CoA hydratase